MTHIQKLPKRASKKRRTGLAIALILLALLLIVGASLNFVTTIRASQQQVSDLMHTQQAGAGQTAVFESRLTQQVHP